jgi:molybdopterin synthase catalytic subunit
VSDKLVERLRSDVYAGPEAEVMTEAAERIEALEQVLRVLIEHRSHCFIPEDARVFPHLHGWTERAIALLNHSAAPERQ